MGLAKANKTREEQALAPPVASPPPSGNFFSFANLAVPMKLMQSWNRESLVDLYTSAAATTRGGHGHQNVAEKHQLTLL